MLTRLHIQFLFSIVLCFFFFFLCLNVGDFLYFFLCVRQCSQELRGGVCPLAHWNQILNRDANGSCNMAIRASYQMEARDWRAAPPALARAEQE